MKKLVLLTILFVLLAACGKPDKETSSQPEEPAKSVVAEADPEKASDKADVAEESKETNASDESADTESPDTSVERSAENSALKEQYLNELAAIEEEIENKPEGETQIEMEDIASGVYEIWDNELNKIWKELEKQLPTAKMNKLREEQRQWIKEKYRIASEEAAQYEGGTMEPLVKVNTQARVTKERCYELVEKYM
ncbi:lysozyme inhibitor LprI family protein [Fredinandcohnia sp. QZ13]|uniref:lysozyme inhibitor LprI family protein n=1 Tax=Fredinandcohnia sp. QZ13 TaxID=3073144 RepID=UPI00285327D1|nr:lysozyme inhibitor LprI family protein [Fredinandcohnia sp. QZ13]MDR4887908.1 lysozyme inhibitor LprI family protein [Fredinandcohnia sp. QZ13]